MSCARRHTGRSKARAKRFERATSTSVTGQRRRSRALAEKRQETRARGDPRVAVRPEATLRHAALSSQSAGPTRPARGSSIPTARAPRGSSLPTARAPTRRRDEWRGELHVVGPARARRRRRAGAQNGGSRCPRARLLDPDGTCAPAHHPQRAARIARAGATRPAKPLAGQTRLARNSRASRSGPRTTTAPRGRAERGSSIPTAGAPARPGDERPDLRERARRTRRVRRRRALAEKKRRLSTRKSETRRWRATRDRRAPRAAP